MRKMRMLVHKMVHKNLAAVCCAVMLAFGLAACSSSSNKTVVTEAEKTINTARTGAMSAATAAKTASDNAKEAADEADAAVMAVTPIFTMTGGGDDPVNLAGLAKEARDAATNAEKYNQETKTESDKAAAAETVTAAADARAAAELAQENAEAQERIAAEKAKMAKDTAAMGIKVSGDTDMARTYSFGDTSITPAALTGKKVETRLVNGKEVTLSTNLIGDFKVSLKEDVAGVEGTAASGGTPEVKAKPIIEARETLVGKIYDSADDKTRLLLFTHYTGSKVVGAYRTVNTKTVEGKVTPNAEHGEYDHDNDDETPSLKVMKAAGEFYLVTGSGALSASSHTDKIEKATKATPIYYYTEPAEGSTPSKKIWIVRSKTKDEAGTITYEYQDVSVVENVKGFPVATPYQHLNYGMWIGNLKANGDDSDADLAELGTAFVVAKAGGKGMTGGDMPASGTATYDGHYVVTFRAKKATGDGRFHYRSDHSTLTANFANDTVMVDLYGLATLEGTIKGDWFSGTNVSGVAPLSDKPANDFLEADTSGANYTGTFSGGFFGPKAAEAGGVFDYTSEGRKKGEFRGAFGGVKQAE